MTRKQKVRKIIELETLKLSLATNFEVPAKVQIGWAASQLGKSVAWVKRQLELAS